MRLLRNGAQLVAAFLVVPVAAAAQDFSGPIIPSVVENGQNLQTCAAGWKAVVIVLAGLVDFAVYIAIIIAVLVAIYAGLLFVFNSTNPENLSKGKTILTNAAIGLLFALGAWLLVNTILTGLGAGSVASRTSILGGGNSLYCIPLRELATNELPSGGGATAGTPRSTARGSCQIQSSGPCSTANLGAFGTAAGEASQICGAESSNGTQLEGDRTTEGKPVSFGLFQINTTVHSIAGLNCPAAYSGRYTGSRKNITITDPVLYQKCKEAALNPTNNIAAAMRIYRQANNSWRDWSTKKKCNLATGYSSTLAIGSCTPFN